MDPMNMQGWYSYPYPFYTPSPHLWPGVYATPQHGRSPPYRGMSGNYQEALGSSPWQQRFSYEYYTPYHPWNPGAGYFPYNFFSTPHQSPSIPFAATPLPAARYARVHAVAEPVVVARGRTSRIQSHMNPSANHRRARSARPSQPTRTDHPVVGTPARIHEERFTTPPAVVAVATPALAAIPVPVLIERERPSRSPNASLQRIPRSRSAVPTPSRPTAQLPFPQFSGPIPTSPEDSLSITPPPLTSLSLLPPPLASLPNIPSPQTQTPTSTPTEPAEAPKTAEPFQKEGARSAPLSQAAPETLSSSPDESAPASTGTPFSGRKAPLNLDIPSHLHHTPSAMPLPVNTGTPITPPTVSHHRMMASPMVGPVADGVAMDSSSQRLPMPATPRRETGTPSVGTPSMGTPWRRPPTPFAHSRNVPTETSLGTLRD